MKKYLREQQKRIARKSIVCGAMSLLLLLPQIQVFAVENQDFAAEEQEYAIEDQEYMEDAGDYVAGEQDYIVQQPDYSIQITPEMERNGTTGIMGEDEETARRISVADNIVYDFDLERYCYPVNQGFIYANVIDGMIVQNGVELSKDDSVIYTIYRDSEPLDASDACVLTDAGSYTVTVGSSDSEKKVFSFQIIGKAINAPLSYELPSGCIASELSVDNEDMLTNNRSLDISQEGYYEITYQCVRNNLQYTLNFTVDHTAPTVTLEGVQDGKARGEVLLLDIEEGAVLEIYKDGDKISAKNKLTQPGKYQVRVSDAAGNASVYSFYILFYLNTGGISFGVILILVIVGLGIYLYISRKRVRVR